MRTTSSSRRPPPAELSPRAAVLSAARTLSVATGKLALQGNPELRFELVGVYAGVDTIVLHYQNQLGGLVNEVLTFRDGLVTVGHATHLHVDA